MRSGSALAISLLLASAPSASSAQLFQMQILKACYTSPAFDVPKGKQVRYAEKLFQQYVELARAPGGLNRVFSDVGYYGAAAEGRRWSLDGVETSPDRATDPWISQTATFRPLGMVLSHTRIGVRAQWQAVSRDGAVLGTYDAFLITHVGGYKLRWLDLYSQGKALQPKPLGVFCSYPGDVEEYQRDPKKKLY